MADNAFVPCASLSPRDIAWANRLHELGKGNAGFTLKLNNGAEYVVAAIVCVSADGMCRVAVRSRRIKNTDGTFAREESEVELHVADVIAVETFKYTPVN